MKSGREMVTWAAAAGTGPAVSAVSAVADCAVDVAAGCVADGAAGRAAGSVGDGAADCAGEGAVAPDSPDADPERVAPAAKPYSPGRIQGDRWVWRAATKSMIVRANRWQWSAVRAVTRSPSTTTS